MATMTTAAARLLLLLVAAAVAVPFCSGADEALAAPTTAIIHELRPRQAALSGQLAARAGIKCGSWRLGVETHNVIGWETVPAECENYVGNYMLGDRYRHDSQVVINEAIAYADSLRLCHNGKEVWVFDVDETSLSNLPYYAKHGFGAKPYNATSFLEYVFEGSAPALPETLRLYHRLHVLGVKAVFLTDRTEDERAVTADNLRRQGYYGWEKLLLKPAAAATGAAGRPQESVVPFKAGERQKLRDAGYIIVGNIGDQWSDILGAPEGGRTFKLPDPMYYIG
ncbi:hypothetical protein GUJ93_ZPchr0005g16165 [Zizania palustris]|uniref:Acid phosphatase n=1 Tax=Zizania palustris TaxID=103762 RepID=A0A8J5SMC7_ZIZPA|nr:hypothetical protein GUJ93_ZPchr0005g16165 [Zizania palustris]